MFLIKKIWKKKLLFRDYLLLLISWSESFNKRIILKNLI